MIDITDTIKKRKDEIEKRKVNGFLLVFNAVIPKTIEIVNKE